MKPLGPIPPGFAADAAGRLLIAGRPAAAWAEAAGDTPCFVYDLDRVSAQVAHLRGAMPAGLRLHYAVKANPYPPLVRHLVARTDGADVASGGELRLALESGADHVSFAGPGKRDRDLEAAIRLRATLNLESEGEAARALALATRIGITPRLAVRVNPEFELRGSGMRMGGGAKPFGVDQARVPALVRRIVDAGAEYRGLHVYAGSQALDAAAIADAQAQSVALARAIDRETGAPAPLVNLGGGFGVPYFAGDRALDIGAVGTALAPVIAGEEARFAIELGRWLVAEAGVYLTRVVDRKESMGKLFLVTDGGLHHQLAASGNFGTVVRRNYPLAIADRFGGEAQEEASVVGCLCTPLDRLADDAPLPRAGVGDLVAVFLAGAYGASASPSGFLGHGPAAEIAVTAAGAQT